MIVLSDPFLAREGGAGELLAALGELPEGVPLSLQLPFGDASSVLPALAEAPVAAIGIDFYSTSLDALPHGLSEGDPRGRPRRALVRAREPGGDRPLRRGAAGPRAGRALPRSERRPAVRSGARSRARSSRGSGGRATALAEVA